MLKNSISKVFYNSQKFNFTVRTEIKGLSKDVKRDYKKEGARIGSYKINVKSDKDFETYEKMTTEMRELKGFDKHPMVVIPRYHRRLFENVNPGEFERIYRNNLRRKHDRAVVRDFCRKVLYLHQKYVPF